MSRDLDMLARVRKSGFRPTSVIVWMDMDREPWDWPPFGGVDSAMEYRATVYLPESQAIASLDLRAMTGLDVTVITRDEHSRLDALVDRLIAVGVSSVEAVRHWQDDPLVTLEVLDGDHV